MTALVDRKKSARRLASEILFKVDTQQAYADILIEHARKSSSLAPRDQALLTEVVYGTLRWRGTIDATLNRHLRRPLAQTDPFILNLLRATLYQILFLDKIPDYAAVHEAVEIAKGSSAKAAPFVNGVLRNILRSDGNVAEDKAAKPIIETLAEELSHPQWLVKRWLSEFGAVEAPALMRANNERAPLVVRVNSLQCSREKLLERFLQDGIDAAPTRWSPQGISLGTKHSVAELPDVENGLFQIQGESSQLVTYLLGPQPGERILDACAAPGGKSTHMAEMMLDRGEVLALDSSVRGIERTEENLARLQLKSVRVLRGDARCPLPGSPGAAFDRILVDAPCSGLGTLRSHPEIKWQRGETDIERLRELQAKILGNLAGYLKSGGVLVYSTCTLTDEENQRQVENFLERHPEFELDDATRYLPESATHMVTGKYFQALPQRDDTDGFFAARMRKAG